MSNKTYENFESVVDYNTVLDDFEGPLDLLLHLINIAQIKIEDVFVSKVTEQFLDYIEFMKTQPRRDVDINRMNVFRNFPYFYLFPLQAFVPQH